MATMQVQSMMRRAAHLLRVASAAGAVCVLVACTPEAPPSAPAAPEAPNVPDVGRTASAQPAAPDRPMDEVPEQATSPEGDRVYRFAGGCEVVVDAARAVVKREGAHCELHHRDIALLYASGD